VLYQNLCVICASFWLNLSAKYEGLRIFWLISFRSCLFSGFDYGLRLSLSCVLKCNENKVLVQWGLE
jgi:hypothetical protein